jgi:hypothetical protein
MPASLEWGTTILAYILGENIACIAVMGNKDAYIARVGAKHACINKMVNNHACMDRMGKTICLHG